MIAFNRSPAAAIFTHQAAKGHTLRVVTAGVAEDGVGLAGASLTISEEAAVPQRGVYIYIHMHNYKLYIHMYIIKYIYIQYIYFI